MFRHVTPRFQLTSSDREQLLAWLRCPTLRAGPVRRARAILLLAEGKSLRAVRAATGLRVRHIRKWEQRFRKLGPAGLHDAKRPGRPPVFSPGGCDAPGQDRL